MGEGAGEGVGEAVGEGVPGALDASGRKHQLQSLLHVARVLETAAGKHAKARLLLHCK